MDIALLVFVLLVFILLIFIIYLLHNLNTQNKNNKSLNENVFDYQIINNETKLQTALIAEKISDFKKENTQVLNDFNKNILAFGETVKESLNKGIQNFQEQSENSKDKIKSSLDDIKLKMNEKFIEIIKELQTSLANMQKNNEQKLEQMRMTVDEKLQKTLTERLNQSFLQVKNDLDNVQKSMGEISSLSTGITDLKKSFNNVKTRGVFGEIQLKNIIENVLTPDQYEVNKITKPGTLDRVEFAIRFPGENSTYVFLPIDSKFPVENYHLLLNASEKADKEEIERAEKLLKNDVKNCAKTIATKYIDVPNTTDYAVMFLPTESLYSEVIKLGIIEDIHSNYRVMIVGPTNMSAFLSTIKMAFRSVTLQKKAYQISKILQNVKKEFETFGEGLQKVKMRLQATDQDLDKLIGTRTNAINRQLREVENSEAELTSKPLIES